MADIRSLFTLAARIPTSGVQGYHLEHKYFDARRSRQQKALKTSRQRTKPINVSPKRSFLDEVCQRQKKLPGPTSYEPYKELKKSLSKDLKTQSPPRLTYFDELQRKQKKWNIPAAGKYDKIQLDSKKQKSRSPMSKAEISNYLDNSMRKSIEYPGVGNYNIKEKPSQAGAPKWKAQIATKTRSQSDRGLKVPQPGTYHPLPASYDLFDSMSSSHKTKSRSYFGKEQRFKNDKNKPVPFYNIGSQWGMKDRLNKKDILSRVGSSVTHHSIYY